MQAGAAATLRQDIADALIENQLGEGEFMNEAIMPVVPVNVKSGEFLKIAFTEIKTQAVNDIRAPGGEYNRITHEVTTDTFTCKKRGLEEPVDDDEAITLGNYFDAEVSAADMCRYYIRLNREYRVAQLAFDTSSIENSALGTAWSTAATATPVKDIEKAKRLIRRQINGMVGANARWVGAGHDIHRENLKATSDIKGRWTSTSGKADASDMTDEQLARALGLDEIHFSGLQRDGSDIWNQDRFGIYLVSDNPRFQSVPRYGNIMLWRNSVPTDLMAESYYENQSESTIVRVKTHTAEKELSTRCAYLYTGVD